MHTTTIQTAADALAALLHDDGQCWEADDGRRLQQIAADLGAVVTYSARSYTDDGDLVHVDGHRAGHLAGDPVRYEFADGSAIVAAGDAWDHEGDARYSWRG